jgi:hypothetical protein
VQGRILLIWPLAAVFVYAASPPYPAHSLETISLPLAVLAMRGWRFVPLRRLLLAGAALMLTVPGVVFAASKLRQSAQLRRTAYILPRDDARAFAFIDRLRVQGGVLAPLPEALAVPALTGRETWIGHPSWTPGFDVRAREAAVLFAGQLTQRAAQHRVLRIGAPIVFAPCGSSSKLNMQLAPVSAAVWRFGCATVWRVAGL